MTHTTERPVEELLAEVSRIADIYEILEICKKLWKECDEDIENMTDEQVKDLLSTHKQCLYKTQHQPTSWTATPIKPGKK